MKFEDFVRVGLENMLGPQEVLAKNATISYRCSECGGIINEPNELLIQSNTRPGTLGTYKFIHPECYDACLDAQAGPDYDETEGLPIGLFFDRLDEYKQYMWEQQQLEYQAMMEQEMWYQENESWYRDY